MELPYRSKAGPDDEAYSEETEEKDVSIDNRLYNGYQGSLMEPADVSKSAEGAANAQNSAPSATQNHHHLSIHVCTIVTITLILRFVN